MSVVCLSVCLSARARVLRYRYLVDLSQMTQTNVDHPNRKMRHIRRNPGKSLANTPPGVGASTTGGKVWRTDGVCFYLERCAIRADFIVFVICYDGVISRCVLVVQSEKK